MPAKPLLGELLIQQDLVSQKTIDNALRLQTGGNRRLGHILVKMQAITSDQLAKTLAIQLGTPITDIEAHFSKEVQKTIPRYLCRKYGVLPLSFAEDNTLNLAMSNPSDEEAIADLERYTDRAIAPCLALDSKIEKAIGKKIPLTKKDFFNPTTSAFATRMTAVMALILVCWFGYVSYSTIHENRYGTRSITKTQTLFENHDLILGVGKNGGISLVGHGAYSQGVYSVAFDNIDALRLFLDSRSKDFSSQQRQWLDWATSQISDNNSSSGLAAAN